MPSWPRMKCWRRGLGSFCTQHCTPPDSVSSVSWQATEVRSGQVSRGEQRVHPLLLFKGGTPPTLSEPHEFAREQLPHNAQTPPHPLAPVMRLNRLTGDLPSCPFSSSSPCSSSLCSPGPVAQQSPYPPQPVPCADAGGSDAWPRPPVGACGCGLRREHEGEPGAMATLAGTGPRHRHPLFCTEVVLLGD